MSKINVSQWKKFKLTELFNVKTGAYLSKNQLKPGSIPRVTVSSVNNGIVGSFERCGLSNERLFSNFLSVNFFGNVFYHDSSCSVDMKVHVLEPKHLYSKESMLFLVAVLRHKFVIEGYGTYGNQLSSSKLKMDMVYLPVDASGNPDWQYMDEYIAKLATQAHTNISLLRQQQKKAPTVNIDRWKEFKIDNLFEKITTKKLPYKTTQLPHHATEDNLIPLVTAGVEHQGRSVYAPKTKDITVLSNCLTISANGANSGATFYQDKPFSILQDAYAIQVKSSINENVSKYEYCFLASVIGKRLQQNDWTNKATWNVVKAKEIRLPVTESDEPDWQYMDEYIAKLATQAHTNINLLRHIVK